MPFITDQTWTPARYRKALAAWRANAAPNETAIAPRAAGRSGKPRHGALSRKLRGLLTWRAMNRGEDWTAVAANDNNEAKPRLLDSEHEVRPRVSEIFAALEEVEFETRRHAKLNGGGADHIVPVGGDIERGKTYGQSRRKVPECVVRLGALHFSNGAAEEPCLKLEAGKPVRGSVRIELGGLTRVGHHRPRDRFGAPKGAAANDNSPTVGANLTATPPAMDFVDPVADAQQALWVRQAVGADVAAILDLALRAANFREIGERLGHAGKVAERQGKQAVIDACAILDKALAA